MTALQWKILYSAAALCFVVNSCALAVCWWCENDLTQRGISIEAILAEPGRK